MHVKKKPLDAVDIDSFPREATRTSRLLKATTASHTVINAITLRRSRIKLTIDWCKKRDTD